MTKKIAQLKLWMFIVLIFLVLFLGLRFVVGYIGQSTKQNEFTINPLDEQGIYKGAAYDIKDDIKYLPQIKPSK